MEVLALLATDTEAEPIAGPAAARRQVATPDRARVERVLDHIHAHYRERISIEALADVAALSPSGFHRLFRRHTRLTVSDYVAELRIGQACALLVNTPAADCPHRRRGRLPEPRQLQPPVPRAEEDDAAGIPPEFCAVAMQT